MTKPGDSVPGEARDDGLSLSYSSGSVARSGDPSLELFGHGWTPDTESTPSDSYTGRHRASDA